MLFPKQFLQRLPIDSVQVRLGNTFKYSLNGIQQIVFCLHRVKEIIKKYIALIKSI